MKKSQDKHKKNMHMDDVHIIKAKADIHAKNASDLQKGHVKPADLFMFNGAEVRIDIKNIMNSF